MKKIKLSAKEIDRSDETLNVLNGRRYTTISRPQPSGKYLVAIVWADTGEIYNSSEVDSRSDVGPEIKNLLRFMDKFGAGGKMASASRHRSK